MITEKIEYSQANLARVDEYAISGDSATVFWSDERTNAVRTEIRDHYKVVQDFTCPYCQQSILVAHGRAWDIEHIACKSEYPRYLFEPQNLCVACIDCNTAKSDKKILVGRYTRRYPTTSDRFNIVHPHFDEYADHIAKSKSGFFVALTAKGTKTIEFCNLARFITKFAGSEKLSLIPNVLDILDLIMSSVSSEDTELQLTRNLDENRTISVSVKTTTI